MKNFYVHSLDIWNLKFDIPSQEIDIFLLLMNKMHAAFTSGWPPCDGRITPFGNRRIKGLWHLPDEYRRHTRPSSAKTSKASTIGIMSRFLKKTFSSLVKERIAKQFVTHPPWIALRAASADWRIRREVRSGGKEPSRKRTLPVTTCHVHLLFPSGKPRLSAGLATKNKMLSTFGFQPAALGVITLVDRGRLELPTSSLQMKCSTSWTNGPTETWQVSLSKLKINF